MFPIPCQVVHLGVAGRLPRGRFTCSCVISDAWSLGMGLLHSACSGRLDPIVRFREMDYWMDRIARICSIAQSLIIRSQRQKANVCDDATLALSGKQGLQTGGLSGQDVRGRR